MMTHMYFLLGNYHLTPYSVFLKKANKVPGPPLKKETGRNPDLTIRQMHPSGCREKERDCSNHQTFAGNVRGGKALAPLVLQATRVIDLSPGMLKIVTRKGPT